MRLKITAILFAGLTIIALPAHAQKLPKVQKTSIRAPENIKIDGKANEWDNKYQAFNKSTGISYIIANDNDNLYLIINSTQSRVIEKMLEGGISFVITDADNKNKTTILFPLLTMPISWSILHNAGKKLTQSMLNIDRDERSDPYGVRGNRDSMLKLKPVMSIETSNDLLAKNLKEIKVSGIGAITDTVAKIDHKSVYYRSLPLPAHRFKLIPANNQDGIKATTQFDPEGNLVYELALPLKHLASSINESRIISYQIILNSRSEDQRFGSSITYKRINNQMILQDMDLETPTSVKGKYILIR